MRIFCNTLAAMFGVTLVALLLAMAGRALAQEPAVPPGRFYGPLVPKKTPKTDAPRLFRGNLQPGELPLKLVLPKPVRVEPASPVSRCAVPLIEMQAPKAVDPAIQLVPRMDNLAPMPQAKLPLPCDVSSSR